MRLFHSICIGLFLGAIIFSGCTRERHFFSDGAYRATVHKDFEAKRAILADSPTNLFSVFNNPMTTEEREALEFLYAYSPLVDIAWYGGDFLLDNVRHALRVREEMPWGKEIPEEVFRHFVLPIRSGNEGIDSSRTVFYNELKERVTACKTMEEAALEVNHWCHEKAVYQPTNARTCSPLMMTTTGYGRCGEEAVFALAAMRSVGIPARQVYTPRWAHCDDNHAWVEVWVDGIWKYMGACEPEPQLNTAWFTAPVRRGLYMEARAFGKYEGSEEVTSANANATALNVTRNYTEVKRVTVVVRNADGTPAEGATVQYRIYNYGEFYPAVTLKTDAKGLSSLTCGLGDWLAWAYKDGKYGYAKLHATTEDTIAVTLDKAEGADFRFDFDVVPPVEKQFPPVSSDRDRAANDRRLTTEDSIRNAYAATFISENEALRLASDLGYGDANLLVARLRASRGNYGEVVDFLQSEADSSVERKELALQLLEVLPDKDLQDITAAILTDHLNGAAACLSDGKCSDAELFRTCVLNPRIKYEIITPYRKPLGEFLSREGIANPEELLAWMKKIRVNDTSSRINFCTPPEGVLRAMVTDTRSLEHFFVSACRTMGVPARLNPLDGKPEYHEGNTWHTVMFAAEQQPQPKGTLMVHYAGGQVADPAYYTHFTISKIEGGRTHLIDLGSNADVDMGGGVSYSAIFAKPVALECGDYLLVTGNRKADGSVLSSVQAFRVEAGKRTDVEMRVRDVTEEATVLGTLDGKITYRPLDGSEAKEFALPKNGCTVIAVMAAGQEPTNHLLRDMSGMKADFEAKGTPMLFLLIGGTDESKFSLTGFRPMPDNMWFGFDTDGSVLQMLERCLQLKGGANLPIVVAVNHAGEISFLSQGYRIEMGRQLIRYVE